MDILHLLRERRSVRKYRGKKIPNDILYSILEAARWAPTSGNLQPVRLVVVEDEAKREELAKAALNQEWMSEAPIIVVVCSLTDRVERWYGRAGKRIYSIQNTSAATQNMIIAAAGYGVSSCWVSAFSDNQVKKCLEIPDDVDIHNLLVLGYANEKPMIPARFHLWELTDFNTWGNKRKRGLAYPFMESQMVKDAKRKVRKTRQRVKDGLYKKFKKRSKK